MNRMRVSSTSAATKMGTSVNSVSRPSTSLPNSWFSSVNDTAHQVMTAFIVAPSSQAPIRYQTAFGSSAPRSGVNSRANPAKSMAQKAMARIVAQVTPQKAISPRMLFSA